MMRDKEDISMDHKNGEKEKDIKEKEKSIHDKEQDRDRERERYRKFDHRYRENERVSLKRVPSRDQRDRGRERDHCSKRECDYESNSKKYYRSDWNQLPRRQLARPSQSLPKSEVRSHHFATLNYHARRHSRSPDHRV